MNYDSRLEQLNSSQKKAVDTIEGPLLIIAGPGTGKTELLSMRTANILRQTDTMPSSILCLTFTDSGAAAMRSRLVSIIGADAYKVAIHTFHSFGSEIISQNAEHFYRGAHFQPADELAQYEILRSIFDELDYTNPLASMNGDEYTHLRDTSTVISELKRSGLTSDELLQVLDTNQAALDALERDISHAFSSRISKSTAHLLAPIAEKAAAIPLPQLPSAITPYANIIALSLAHAIDEAIATDSTKPISAWKKTWCEKNARDEIVLKDRRRHEKLRSLANIYYQYLARMEESGLYDYDDMIMNVLHAVETHPELRHNLREKYHYIMVDEFQDTNLAQLRLLFGLTHGTEQPNVMAVGDDDQAIYSFQGADVGNIQRFRTEYDDPAIIVLTDNYRSDATILHAARQVITQGIDRLENTIEDLSKNLSPHATPKDPHIFLREYSSAEAERFGLATAIRQQLDDGIAPESIAVLARRHHELVALLPYLAHNNIAVNYERRENVLDDPLIRLIEHLAAIIDALHREAHDEADALLPEILSHPAWGYSPQSIYQLSLTAYRDHRQWLDIMQTIPTFKSFADWLVVRTAAIHVEPFEQQIDAILGITDDADASYTSPLYGYFFSDSRRDTDPQLYLATLEALRTIRQKLSEHHPHDSPNLGDFLEYMRLHRELGASLTAIRRRGDLTTDAIHLMTAHKSKGLEFDHVHIIGAIDSAWGERTRSRSRLISYPANLPLAPSGDNYDERLRLFFVAMTRAKATLDISYSTVDAKDKESLIASFLSDIDIEVTESSPVAIDGLTTLAEIDWRGHLTNHIDTSLRDLLAPTLERYKLSATHLGNFLDVSRGGPQHFLLNNLLRFPQARSAHASYGTAMHATLQRAHDYLRVSNATKPIEDIIGEFEKLLLEQHISQLDYDSFYARGADALQKFLSQAYPTFSTSQRTEVGFGDQGVVVGEARLTGALDLVDIDETARTILVTDYKTGRATRDWQGKTEYERIKLHKYRQQLMFYQLLVEGSRDYSKYSFTGGVLQFIEPDSSGDIVALEQVFSQDELEDFRRLIAAVWRAITTLDLPDISGYDPTLKGVLAFEKAMIDRYA